MRRQRTTISLAFAALVVALLGSTSVGQAASGAVKAGVNHARASKYAGPLRSRVLRGPRGPRGKRGPRGRTGPPGAQGPQGLQGIQAITAVVVSTPVPPLSVRMLTATCPAGQTVISGGVFFVDQTWESEPASFGAGWVVTGFNSSSSYTWTLWSTAYCSPNVTVTRGAWSRAVSESQTAELKRHARAESRGER